MYKRRGVVVLEMNLNPVSFMMCLYSTLMIIFNELVAECFNPLVIELRMRFTM